MVYNVGGVAVRGHVHVHVHAGVDVDVDVCLHVGVQVHVQGDVQPHARYLYTYIQM